jgi:hypothetical protein
MLGPVFLLAFLVFVPFVVGMLGLQGSDVGVHALSLPAGGGVEADPWRDELSGLFAR